MAQLEEKHIVLPGGTTCPGCGGAVINRMIFNFFGKNIIQFGSGGCGDFLTPKSLPTFSLHHSGVVSGGTGIVAALEMQGRNIPVVSLAGDGAASDTSFGKLSAAALRNDNLIQIVFDNEAYMNTGGQKSDLTPLHATTRTTPLGKETKKMDLPMIMAYHYIPYIATVTCAYPQDLFNKLKKAQSIKGFRYIHCLNPCPTGWGYNPAKSIEVSRMAVQTKAWTLYEVENGNLKITYKPREFKPIKEYLRLQNRFARVTDEQADEIQKVQDETYQRILAKDGKNIW